MLAVPTIFAQSVQAGLPKPYGATYPLVDTQQSTGYAWAVYKHSTTHCRYKEISHLIYITKSTT